MRETLGISFKTMKKYLIFSMLITTIILQSCDPGGMSFIRNYSDDTLKLQLKYSTDTIINYSSYCKSFYENIYCSDYIIPNNKLNDWYEIMEKKPSNKIGDSLLEIVVPPKNTIITNNGIAAFRLFKNCACDYVIFILGEHSDTLNRISNYEYEELIEFYNRNEIKLTTKSGLFYRVDITDIYKIK